MIKTDYPVARQFHSNTSYIADRLPKAGILQSGIKPFKEYPRSSRITLPLPAIPDISFKDVLIGRHSCRQFKNQPVALGELADILFAGYGFPKTTTVVRNEFKQRTVPSAGALYPLEFYILVMSVDELAPGIYHYLPQIAQLEFIHQEPLPVQLLNRLFLQQSWITEAGAVIIATAVIERTLSKYLDRGYRYIMLEAGHAFQNMNLMAAACKTGAADIGAFLDEEIADLLQINAGEESPIYAMALGVED